MSTKNQREQLTHTAVWQITVIVLVLIVSWIYVIPRYQTLSETIAATNDIIEKFTSTTNDGIPYTELSILLKNSKWKEELLGIIQSAPKETQSVIKKIGSDPYLTWLGGAISASTVDKDRLALKKARLNSILPTLNPVSNNVTEETVSMRRYIAFVENNILRQFGIESTAALGIQNIKYGKKGTDMPEVLGSFDTEITFTATNDGITKMIGYINTLGRPDILLDTGSTSTWGTPDIMSNPLAMINALSLQTTLDPTKPTEENGGRMVLRFYIRWSSLTDIAFLSGNIKARKEALKKKIEINIAACAGELTCPRKKDLDAFSRKYTEFDRAVNQNKPKLGTEMIYALSSQLDSINALEKEFKNITSK